MSGRPLPIQGLTVSHIFLHARTIVNFLISKSCIWFIFSYFHPSPFSKSSPRYGFIFFTFVFLHNTRLAHHFYPHFSDLRSPFPKIVLLFWSIWSPTHFFSDIAFNPHLSHSFMCLFLSSNIPSSFFHKSLLILKYSFLILYTYLILILTVLLFSLYTVYVLHATPLQSKFHALYR